MSDFPKKIWFGPSYLLENAKRCIVNVHPLYGAIVDQAYGNLV